MSDRHKNRGGLNKVELSGKKFGKLTVVRDTGRRKSKRPIWLCICECGNEKEVLGKYLTNGDTKSCGCITKGNAHNRNCVGEITMSLWTPILAQAKRRGIPLEITREEAWDLFVSQDRKCALSGAFLEFAKNLRDQRYNQTASLDRIDNDKGYVIGNIQWVHKRINIMKNTLNNEDFIGWCGSVYHRSKHVRNF